MTSVPGNTIVTEEEKTNQRNEAKKRNITEKTEDAYWRAMKRVKRGLGLSDDDGDMDFLLDYDTVHEWIEELTLSPSSKKTLRGGFWRIAGAVWIARRIHFFDVCTHCGIC